jgi:GNAT superfamily N-acetyltransferase
MMQLSWQQTQPLRSSVPGWPSGPVPGDEDAAAVHLAERNPAGEVTAVVSFMPHLCPDRPNQPAVYLWGMAVAPDLQRQGAGRRLVEEVLVRARAAGAQLVWADARESAVGFYERCGWRMIGEPVIDDVTGLMDRRVIVEVG